MAIVLYWEEGGGFGEREGDADGGGTCGIRVLGWFVLGCVRLSWVGYKY